MSSEQLSTRIISEQARISSNDIRRGRISDDQFDKFLETSKNSSELPLYIDETPAISVANRVILISLRCLGHPSLAQFKMK